MAERHGWRRRRLDPEMATGLALTVALVATIVGGIVVGVLALLVRHSGTLRGVDASAANWGNDHSTHLSSQLLQHVTDLGDWPLVPLIAIAVLIVELWRRPSWFLIPFVLVVTLGDQLVTSAIKEFMDRARPTLNPVAATLGPSFPSGHSSTAAAFYAALALILSRGRPAARARSPDRHGSRHRGGGRVEPGAARRALALGRDRGTVRRLDVVRRLRDRLRRAHVALRRAGRGARRG